MTEPEREPAAERTAPKAAVGRVCLYLRQLETFQKQGETTISSSKLGGALSLTDAQVRKDLAFFGQFGYPGIGYKIDELIGSLRHVLGVDREWRLVLIGLGNLGRALLGYKGFLSRGFRIVSILDNDPDKIGREVDGLTVRPISDLAEVIAAEQVSLAILAVPAEHAQRLADQLAAQGVSGILNFAPVALTGMANVSVVSVDLSIQLEHLTYKVTNALGGSSHID